MYLIGTLAGTRFKLVYAIFEDKLNADEHLKNIGENFNISEMGSFEFPFFIIEELDDTGNSYCPINKEDFKKRITMMEKSNDANAIYFNLWRINSDSFNKDFPSEPYLNGRDWHLHFMGRDLEDIESIGFEKYWDDLLGA